MEGIVALRQIMENDLLRASSIRRYGMNSLMATTLYLQKPNYLKKDNSLEQRKLPLQSADVCYLFCKKNI
jgi:hypothetical protein